MAIIKEEVLKVAKLARVELSDADEKKFQTQLSDILTYVDQLQAVNTEGVEPTAQVTGLENAWRDDNVQRCDQEIKEKALDQAPEKVTNLVKVKSVFK